MGISAAISIVFGLATLRFVARPKMKHAKETMAKLKAEHDGLPNVWYKSRGVWGSAGSICFGLGLMAAEIKGVSNWTLADWDHIIKVVSAAGSVGSGTLGLIGRIYATGPIVAKQS